MGFLYIKNDFNVCISRFALLLNCDDLNQVNNDLNL